MRYRKIRAVLLTAAGDAFCTGADLAGAIPTGDELLTRGKSTRKNMEELSNPLITSLRAVPVPVVTAAPGVVAGAGVGNPRTADVVIAACSADLYLPFVQGSESCRILEQPGALKGSWGAVAPPPLTLLGNRLPAAQAQQWVLVGGLLACPADTAHEHVLDECRIAWARSTNALRICAARSPGPTLPSLIAGIV